MPRMIGRLNLIPAFTVPVLIYNVLAIGVTFLSSDPNAAPAITTKAILSIPMPHGFAWQVSAGDLILSAGLVSLFFGLVRSTHSTNTELVSHSMAMILFVVCLVEFLLLRPFATSTFFLLTCMVLMDVLAGFITSAISARRDIDFGG